MFSADLIEKVRTAQNVLILTGAGVSAESGIPTFRDALSGLWERFDAEDLATPAAFRKDQDLVWGWYEWRRMKVMRALPNPAHVAIAELAHLWPKLYLVTQNVDDLHERAGSVAPIHLHGSLFAPRCFACQSAYQLPIDPPDEPEGGRRLSPPRCVGCGGFVRPGVVWFGENLPSDALALAFAAAGNCDLMLSVGTSGLVQPAASIPEIAYQAGATVVQINLTATPIEASIGLNFGGSVEHGAAALDRFYAIRGQAGTVLPALVKAAFG